ncbi:UDP-glucose/GDP-mannose dehydrogenase family protein [Myxococcota bacterium]|nr:UDP-glucose/GDP-mannose dehydrogenase family protein [Myxococcota bacterium]
MNVCVIGSGYVGLVTGAGFAEFGVQVVCVDKDADKIAKLESGEMPIYEPGLEDLVARNVREGRLSFSTDTPESVRNSLVLFIAVPTPSRGDGGTDLSYVEAVAREIGRSIDGYKVIVTKSTVPVGTSAKVRGWVEEELAGRSDAPHFSTASNPEFLREGAAISDFMRPDRIVIGTEDEQATAILKDLYRPLYLNETPVVITNVPTAELTKYAANAFLATKISFINEIADLCEETGADVQSIARGIGLDNRIGTKFLHAGPGFGGSCFPKDTRSLVHFARESGNSVEIVEAVVRINEKRSEQMIEKVIDVLGGDAEGKTVACLGLSFKPETDDMREAPSIGILSGLIERGASIRAYDPQAMEEAGQLLPDVTMCENSYDACEGAHVLVIMTEWNQFRMLDLGRVKQLLTQPAIVDLRNVYNPQSMMEAGFSYLSVGR